MDSTTYIANAIKTESVPASLEINQCAFHALLEVFTATAQLADLVKRRLFYGSRIESEVALPKIAFINNLTAYLGASMHAGDVDINLPLSPESLAAAALPEPLQGLNLANIDIRLLHCAIGIFTESGEQLEAIKAQYETGILDRVNFGEEVGDVEWYQAIGFDASGVTEASCREKNIAKLKARYPGKFTVEAALNRDLTTERAILEGGQRVLPGGGEIHSMTLVETPAELVN